MNCATDTHQQLFEGVGTWQREARQVALLMAELELPLDAEELLLHDVRELMVLRKHLVAALGRIPPATPSAAHVFRPLSPISFKARLQMLASTMSAALRRRLRAKLT